MNKSHRQKRSGRHHKNSKAASLNLVSLMDIFTILVFFLLINSGDVEVLQRDDTLELPSSVSEKTPEETLLLMVNQESIILDGRLLAQLDSLELTDDNQLVALSEELAYRASRKAQLTDREEEFGLSITIMGDKDTPYNLLKILIKTCTTKNYRDIALAVNKVPFNESEFIEGASIAPAVDI